MMPQPAIKLVWSLSACSFCPRNAVRTCQIKAGKLLPKLAAALDVEEEVLESSVGICTCCLADVDMIIRAVAIRGAMKEFFLQQTNQKKQIPETTHSVSIDSFCSNIKSSLRKDSSVESRILIDNFYLNGSTSSSPMSYTKALLPQNLTLSSDTNKELAFQRSPPQPSPCTPTSLSDSTKKKDVHLMYQCILCDKVAGSKSHCMEHLICHSSVRPFTCKICSKSYKSKKACREHLIIMHGLEKEDPNLYDLISTDSEGLRQLEDVCTQYRKIYSPLSQELKEPLTFEDTTECPKRVGDVKKGSNEPKQTETDVGSKSDWLYGSGTKNVNVTPINPEKILLSEPSSTLSGSVDINLQYNPPIKRTRKGVPHKIRTEETESWESFLNSTVPHADSTEICAIDYTLISPSEVYLGGQANKADNLCNEDTNGKCKAGQSQRNTENDALLLLNSPVSPLNKKNAPPCDVCGRWFPTKEKMNDHMRSHSEVKQFSCILCSRFFKYRRGVTNHLKEVHRLVDRDEIGRLVASHEVGEGQDPT